MQRVEQRAEIIIAAGMDADVDLAFVTDFVGVEPTYLHRQGAPRGRQGRTYRRSLWAWETEDVAEYDSEAVLRVVLDRFEPHNQAIRELCVRHNLEVGLGLIIEMYGDIEPEEDGILAANVPTPALHLTIDTIRRIAELGASLDVDQYVVAPDSEEAAHGR